jgi:hypothetical protein
MPRCTTCSLLFKVPWDQFLSRLYGPEKADAYHFVSGPSKCVAGTIGIRVPTMLALLDDSKTDAFFVHTE